MWISTPVKHVSLPCWNESFCIPSKWPIYDDRQCQFSIILTRSGHFKGDKIHSFWLTEWQSPNDELALSNFINPSTHHISSLTICLPNKSVQSTVDRRMTITRTLDGIGHFDVPPIAQIAKLFLTTLPQLFRNCFCLTRLSIIDGTHKHIVFFVRIVRT